MRPCYGSSLITAVFEMLGEMRAKRAGSSDVQFDLPFLQSVFEDPEMEFLMQTYDKLIEERTRNGELSDGVETVDEVGNVKGALLVSTV